MSIDDIAAVADIRPVSALPKAHLHLHFTGSMRHSTLLELAERDGIRLPSSLTDDWPPALSTADEKGWFRFQRLYDVARSVLRTEEDVRRLVLEAALDDAADGSVWTEIQVDPSGYGARFGGITAFTDLATSYRRWKRNQPFSSIVLSSGGHSSVNDVGRRMPSRSASSSSVPWRMEPVKCRCRWAFGRVRTSRGGADAEGGMSTP